MSEVLKGQSLPCSSVQSLLPTAIHGRLTDSLMKSLEEHLALCPTCRAEYEELTLLQGDLSGLLDSLPSAPTGLWAKIEASIGDEESERASPYRLVESCLQLLVSLGVPEWSIAPAAQSIALAKRLRQGQLPAPVSTLIRNLAAG